MRVFRIRSLQQYTAHVERMQAHYARYRQFEQTLIPSSQRAFEVPGFSYPAGKVLPLLVDFQYAPPGQVNWRERLVCPQTQLNNRMRATLHLLDGEVGPYRDDPIYISEQVTAFYQHLITQFSQITGSEYLGDRVPRGACDARGVRNEDMTRLTFADGSFAHAISLDCLEHVPDYPAAFRELARILRPGGMLLWSVPFERRSPTNIVRARLAADGTIEHLLPPEYHGDPLSADGCLCFTTFGWECLDQIRAAGFSDAYVALFWSDAFGYLGGEQMLLFARK